ncbi:MAG: prenyltransferase [Nitrososphaerota archaeon]|nr:prenyltransferase [Candidatus Calditenuis fumarioli]
MRVAEWFLASRPWSFVMTLISSSLGGVLAFKSGSFDAVLFVLVLAGLVVLHAATNLANDIYDVNFRVDVAGAPTTRYRPHPLAYGVTTKKTYALVTASLYTVSLGIATYLSLLRGPLVIAFALAGTFLSVFYTAPPLTLKYRAFGEASVIATWGPLMVGGTYLVLTGRLEAGVLLTSIPVGCLVGAVLLANNLRDIEYDRSANIRTVATVLGLRWGFVIFAALLAVSYLIVLIQVAFRLLPPTSLAILVTVPMAVKMLSHFRRSLPVDSDARVAGLTMFFGAALIIGILLG